MPHADAIARASHGAAREAPGAKPAVPALHSITALSDLTYPADDIPVAQTSLQARLGPQTMIRPADGRHLTFGDLT